MEHLLTPSFWLIAAAMYVLLRLAPPMPRTAWFGLLNVIALGAMVGPAYTLVAAAFALGVWAAVKKRAAAAGLILLVALFIAHKINLERAFAPAGVWSNISFGPGRPLLTALAALSFSYVFLRACDAVRSARSGMAALDPASMFGYLFPFHMLIAGPISLYKDHLAMNGSPPPAPGFARLVEGVSQITTGLMFKLVIAEGLRLYANGLAGPWRGESLADSCLLLAYLYFDFAGYSMAMLGIGRLIGVPTPINFRLPMLSASVTDFWLRWHVSLGVWVRTNIFFPLQVRLVRAWGVGRANAAGLLVLIAAFAFTGLWHRFSPRFALWGLVMGAVMALEKLVRDRCLRQPWARAAATRRLVRVLGPVYALAVVIASVHWIIGLRLLR